MVSLVRILASLLLCFVCAKLINAQTFPSRPITVVNPYPAGGGADNLVRALATHLSQDLGQPVLVENRPGAGSGINESGDPRVERAKNWTIYGAGRCHQLGFFC